jgi:Calcium-activated BK potassium channel alpha subunit/Calcium-activated potassium channel slowpoke-like RCK domain/Ion channel
MLYIYVFVHLGILFLAYVWDQHIVRSIIERSQSRKHAEPTTTSRLNLGASPDDDYDDPQHSHLPAWQAAIITQPSRKTLASIRKWKFWFNIPEVLFSLAVCGWFVRRTYSAEYSTWMKIAEGCFNLFFMAHIALRTLDTNGALRFFAELRTTFDLLAIVTSFYAISSDIWVTFTFFRAVQVRHALRELNIGGRFGLARHTRHLDTLALDATMLVYIFACTISLVEQLGDVPHVDIWDRTQFTFVNSVYFIFTTVSTVGYGDLTPKTIVGRYLVIGFIVVGIITFTDSSARLIALVQTARRGRGSFRNSTGDPFIVICGTPSSAMVSEILEEFYHHERISTDKMALRRQVVLLLEGSNFDEIRDLIAREHTWQRRVVCLSGSSLSAEDLDRVNIVKSEACFIMNSNDTDIHRSDRSDAVNIMRAMSISQFAAAHKKPELPVYLLLQGTKSGDKLISARVPLESFAIREQLKMAFFAMSCIAPGLSTMIFNLVKTREDETRNQQVNPRDEWQLEYLRGAAMEIYVVHLYREFWNKPFASTAMHVYREFNMILFGILTPDGAVSLNPKEIGEGCLGLLIAATDDDAELIGRRTYVAANDDERTLRENRLNRSFSLKEIPSFRDQNAIAPHHDQDGRINADSNVLLVDDLVDRLELPDEKNSTLRPTPNELSEQPKYGRVPDDTESPLQQQDNDGLHEYRRNRHHSSVTDNVTEDELLRANRGSKSANHTEFLVKTMKSDTFLMKPLLIGADQPMRVRHHVIVVCDSAIGLPHFIRPIRERERRMRKRANGEKKIFPQPIVIVCPQPYNYEDFTSLTKAQLERVYYFRGPLLNRYLFKIQMHECNKIVVLATHQSGDADQADDADVIFKTLQIKHFLSMHCVQDLPFIMSELVTDSSIRFLTENVHTGQTDDIVNSPTFASGEVMAGSIAHLMLVQSYFNSFFLRVIDTLMASCSSEHGSQVFSVDLKGDLKQFVHQPFLALLNHLLLARRQVPLALYRNNNHSLCPRDDVGRLECQGHSAPRKYVYTLPSADTILCEYDTVYVLSQSNEGWVDEFFSVQLARSVSVSGPRPQFSTKNHPTTTSVGSAASQQQQAHRMNPIYEHKDGNGIPHRTKATPQSDSELWCVPATGTGVTKARHSVPAPIRMTSSPAAVPQYPRTTSTVVPQSSTEELVDDSQPGGAQTTENPTENGSDSNCDSDTAAVAVAAAVAVDTPITVDSQRSSEDVELGNMNNDIDQ